ncbi:ArsC family transcriptional regulator [Eubacteriales bacterium]|nr:ArsC family transcriptional regulator [Oscillospiraceae bacterium]MCM0703901.1 ArsC family transcriptional regulator [Faecalicatena sp. BF-R-105]GKH52197.1 ArsC family transcriptional regulator [Eubacteriales bacterium]GKH64916.1 ArsC family transcriptional regulator [Eubacteriales bacterium]SFI45358.1 Arsenate reductase, glutaredoxin family [Ruminococcaceae bacterium D5]
MNIQIFGKSKCFDTKKAERYFKERGIRVQSVDLPRYGLSAGEFASVCRAVGGWAALLDEKHPDAALVRCLASDTAREEKLLENPRMLRTPIVRNGRQATVGYCPEVWAEWK